MSTLLVGLTFFVLILGVVGWLWIVVKAFSEGELLWGLGSLILGPVCIVYGLLNFEELKIPTLMVIGGIVGRILIGVVASAIV